MIISDSIYNLFGKFIVVFLFLTLYPEPLLLQGTVLTVEVGMCQWQQWCFGRRWKGVVYWNTQAWPLRCLTAGLVYAIYSPTQWGPIIWSYSRTPKNNQKIEDSWKPRGDAPAWLRSFSHFHFQLRNWSSLMKTHVFNCMHGNYL